MAKNSGLGRGLGALLGESATQLQEPGQVQQQNVTELAISQLEPGTGQPRKNFEADKIQELAKSIQEYGIVQPIIVKKKENGYYQIIAGERRWRAARVAGLKKVPVIVREYEDERILEIALIENLQREDLNPIEEAQSYQRLMEEYGYTQEELSKKLGKSRPQIANTLRLLGLCEPVQQLLMQKKLSSGHARCLLAISDEQQQLELANLFIERDYSVRQAEEAVKKISQKPQSANKGSTKKNYLHMELESGLSEFLGTKVQISETKKKGKIEIEYYSAEDLERIIQKITT